jgi:hypothetical protein
LTKPPHLKEYSRRNLPENEKKCGSWVITLFACSSTRLSLCKCNNTDRQDSVEISPADGEHQSRFCDKYLSTRTHRKRKRKRKNTTFGTTPIVQCSGMYITSASKDLHFPARGKGPFNVGDTSTAVHPHARFPIQHFFQCQHCCYSCW